MTAAKTDKRFGKPTLLKVSSHKCCVPDKKCVEGRSLKRHLCRFRNARTFSEEAANTVLDGLGKAVSPRRAGIAIKVKCNYGGPIDE